jgi:hypothetical protein
VDDLNMQFFTNKIVDAHHGGIKMPSLKLGIFKVVLSYLEV